MNKQSLSALLIFYSSNDAQALYSKILNKKILQFAVKQNQSIRVEGPATNFPDRWNVPATPNDSSATKVGEVCGRTPDVYQERSAPAVTTR